MSKMGPDSAILDDHHILFIWDNSLQLRQPLPLAFVLKRIPCNEISCEQCNQWLKEHPPDQHCWQWIPIEMNGIEIDSRFGDICLV